MTDLGSPPLPPTNVDGTNGPTWRTQPDGQPPAPAPSRATAEQVTFWSPSSNGGSTNPPPPATDDARSGGSRAGRLVAVALVAAVAGAGVAFPVASQVTEQRVDAAVAEALGVAGPGVEDGSSGVGAGGAGVVDAPSGLAAGADIASIAAEVSPSVVSIEVVGTNGAGSGSGVVYTAEGMVLTNAHVVDGAREVTVVLPTGERLSGRIVGADARSDIAVLEVEPSGRLPVPAFAIGEARVGETSVAIGSPFGLSGSVTSGIVSALNRSLPNDDGTALVDLVQTDAAINPGNSGGALVNDRAEVIGINTAIINGSGLGARGGNDGIGFAVPIQVAQGVADQLIETGEVRRPYLGVQGQTLGEVTAEAYDLELTSGVVLAEVVPGEAAAEAGLAEGDVITGIGDEPVRTMPDLLAALQRLAPGDTVDLTVVTDGDERTVSLTLGELPD